MTSHQLYEVTGMFHDGQVEVHQLGTDHYQVLRIDDLMADKMALDKMVKVYATAVTDTEERDGYYELLDMVRDLPEEDNSTEAVTPERLADFRKRILSR